MALRFVLSLAVMAVVLAEPPPPPYSPRQTYHPTRPTYKPKPTYRPQPTYRPKPTYTPQPTYHPQPTYPKHPSYTPKPVYHPPQTPAYGPTPTYGLQPSYGPPACALETTKPWCTKDKEYPTYEVQQAANQHKDKLLTLYADVANLSTIISVDRPKTLYEETYLCPSETEYVRLLRAQNTDGKWRIIVNNIKVDYMDFTQTTRIEECLKQGHACPLVPQCYESKCLQKSIYHRFLVYDPYDQYFPFAIETFKLPASCACLLGASNIEY